MQQLCDLPASLPPVSSYRKFQKQKRQNSYSLSRSYGNGTALASFYMTSAGKRILDLRIQANRLALYGLRQSEQPKNGHLLADLLRGPAPHHRLDPAATLHFRGSQSSIPTAPANCRDVEKGTFINPNSV